MFVNPIRPFLAHRPTLSPSSTKENHQSFAAILSSPTAAASSSIAGATSKSRLRLGGIGRAPTSKINRAGHSSKPYARSTSISRAKALATPSAKTKPRPPPLKLAPLTAPSAVPTLRVSTTGIGNLQKAIKIPVKLPRPAIPPVEPVDGIPADYFFSKLRPLLHGLNIISSSYDLAPGTSAPSLSSDDFTPPRVFERQRTVPFALPKSAQFADLESKIAGRKPTICLAVWGRDRKGPARLVPANEVVYSSQCAFWPRLTLPPSDEAPIQTEKQDQLETIAESEEAGCPIDSEETETSADSTFAPSSTASSTSSITGKLSATFEATLSSTAITETSERALHLPIVPLTLPSPETFSILHHHLHNPGMPLAPILLDMPKTASSRSEALSELERLSISELMAKLERIHAVWKNVCVLGIPAERTWCGMAEAWSCVIDVLTQHAPRSGTESA